MKQRKEAPSYSSPSTVRQEIDALVRGISDILKRDPKKTAKVLELWVNEPPKAKNLEPKKKAG